MEDPELSAAGSLVSSELGTSMLLEEVSWRLACSESWLLLDALDEVVLALLVFPEEVSICLLFLLLYAHSRSKTKAITDITKYFFTIFSLTSFYYYSKYRH